MTGNPDRVQEALAAHLEHLEVGGPAPDLSHLTPDERARLDELVAVMELTDGVALGRGTEGAGVETAAASTEQGAAILAALRDALPPGARIGDDPAATTVRVEGMDVREGWIVGTFGGRVRVWLLGGEDALAGSDAWLRDLGRVFRLFPDTAAVGLVEGDGSCLLVQPQDCAPTIEVPRGTLVGRRYRRPVNDVAEAVPAFVRELIPYWEPMLEISGPGSGTVDVAAIARERAAKAVDDQVAAGGRARKANPKRRVLTALGDAEAAALAEAVLEVHEGRSSAEELGEALRKMAGRP